MPDPRRIVFSTLMLLAAANTPATADTLSARWKPHLLKFHFAGFTSYYTCNGLRDQVKVLLRAAGARDDVRIEGACAGLPNQPRPSHTLVLGFSVPVSVAAGTAGSPDEVFPAEWREIEISSGHPRQIQGGDCELVEQFAKKVLPLFNPGPVASEPNCYPHQLLVGEPVLRATLLIPVPAAGETPALE